MKKSPFFSIPIATYNRQNELKFALKRILVQSFTDFEVLISDDNSSDDTKMVVESFKDKRVTYYRNKKNLGAVKNIGKVLSYASGIYVFMHGDDDYLLDNNVLQKAYDLIKKNNYGLVRLNYLYQSLDKKQVFDYSRNKFIHSSIKLQAQSNPLEVLTFMEKVDFYFITGIIFKNPYPRKIHIIDTEFIPWFTECYKALLMGGYYDVQYRIIASWSHQKKHPVYYVKNGKLPWENLYSEIRKKSNESYFKEALYKQLAISVNFLMSIKYNSDNNNLVRYAKRILVLNPDYKHSPKFWLYLLLAFIFPKFLLRFVRYVYLKTVSIRSNSYTYSSIIKKINVLRGRD